MDTSHPGGALFDNEEGWFTPAGKTRIEPGYLVTYTSRSNKEYEATVTGIPGVWQRFAGKWATKVKNPGQEWVLDLPDNHSENV